MQRISANRQLRAVAALLVVALAWGSTFPLNKTALNRISPAGFVVGRFGLALLCWLPFAVRRAASTSKNVLQYAAILGFLNSLVYLLLNFALARMPASRCALMIGANVIFVPIFSHMAGMGKLQWLDVASGGLCLLGLGVLTQSQWQLHSGEWLMLACEVVFAVYLVVFSYASRTIAENTLLTFYQILFTLPLPLLWAGLDSYHAQPSATWLPWLEQEVLFALLFCAIGATLLPFYLQAKYQGLLRTSTAAMLLALEPFFAALTSYATLQEPIGLSMWIGAAMIFTAALLPNLTLQQV